MAQKKPNSDIPPIISQRETEPSLATLFKSKENIDDLELKEMALEAYEQAIQLAPHEAVLYYHKGQILEQLGRLSEAQRAFTDARNLGHVC